MAVFDTGEMVSSISSTLDLFQVFIVLIGVIAFSFAFFMLLISTTANIRENIWEFGVLRAIGLRKDQIMRIYLYESLAVTLGA
jgi:ABC-type antimicrobial peptide transport system permease subunit